MAKARTALLGMGLKPMTWDEFIASVQSGSQDAQGNLSADELATLRRYHRNFTAYPTESTLQKFYGFCYSHKLHQGLAAYRFERLVTLLSTLDEHLTPGLSLGEVGAGGGIILRWLLEHKSPRHLAAYDVVPEARALWPVSVHPLDVHAPTPSEKLDVLLCIDSLGEMHDDTDQALSRPDAMGTYGSETLLEQRYGFAQKLAPWKAWLKPQGRAWIIEPIAHAAVWSALAVLLTQAGWRVQVRQLTSGQPFLECQLN